VFIVPRTDTYQTEEKVSVYILPRNNTYQTEQKVSVFIVPRTDTYQTEQKDSANTVLRTDTSHNYQRRPKLDAEWVTLASCLASPPPCDLPPLRNQVPAKNFK